MRNLLNSKKLNIPTEENKKSEIHITMYINNERLIHLEFHFQS